MDCTVWPVKSAIAAEQNKYLGCKREDLLAAGPEVAAPVCPVPKGGVGSLVHLAVPHHSPPCILDGPVRQPLHPQTDRFMQVTLVMPRDGQASIWLDKKLTILPIKLLSDAIIAGHAITSKHYASLAKTGLTWLLCRLCRLVKGSDRINSE